MTDGAAALAALRAGTADLLLTDVMMPVLDGIGLTQAVRADPALRTLPVIMLSARAGGEAGVEGLEAGADDYLVKPFSARELRARVRANLELARLRAEAQEQVVQARKMEAVEQLTAGVAHDFNNLLAAVMGSVELAERKVADERALRLLRNAMQAAQRGAKLTEQLLAFSRGQRLDARPTDLNGLLSGMAEQLHRTLGGGTAVVTFLAADLWPAVADERRVELAVLNLATNARDALHGGGEVRIGTENLPARTPRPASVPAGDFVVLTLDDTSGGMPPEVLARAFEPFFTTKPQGKGTGFGLAQVYGTARQLGGAVTVRSRPGEGTTVSVYLPRAEAVAEGGPDSGREETYDPNETARILVVDDDPQVRSMAVALLDELGYVVDEAVDGTDALRLLQTGRRFDLMLTDYAMPKMTGVELAVRAKALAPGLGILLMTGYADAGALPAGALPVLRKPFGLDDLGTAVKRLLTDRPSRVLPFRRPDDAKDERAG